MSKMYLCYLLNIHLYFIEPVLCVTIGLFWETPYI